MNDRSTLLLGSVAVIFATVAAAQVRLEPQREPRIEQRVEAPPPNIVWRLELSRWTYTLLFSADGARLVALGGDTASVFDAIDGALVREIDFLPPRGNRSAALSASDTLAVTAGTYVDLYDLEFPERIDRLACSACNRSIRRVAFSPDGSKLALQDSTTQPERLRGVGAVRVIDLATQQVVVALEAAGYIGTLSFSGDGQKLLAPHSPASGPGEQSGFRVWDTSDWKVLRTEAFPETGSIAAGAVDGADFVAIHGNDGNIELRDLSKDLVLWSVPFIEPQFELLGGDRLLFDRQELRSIAIAPDGSFVVSYEGQLARNGVFEGAIVVRRARDGDVVGLYNVFDVTSLAIAPDSQGFAFTSRLDRVTHQLVSVRGIP